MKYRDLGESETVHVGDQYYSVAHQCWQDTVSAGAPAGSVLSYRRLLPDETSDKYGTRIQDGDEYEVSEGVWEKVHPDSVGLPQSLFTNYRRPPLDTRSEEDVQPEWISVADALPGDIDDVLLLRKDSGAPDSGWYDETRGWWLYTGGGEEIVDDVTHWHPAPPLPESKPAVDPDEAAFSAYLASGGTAFNAWPAFQAALAYARKERE